MTVSLTVAICTYNRAASLGRTLSSLAAQARLESLGWELLIVDNNSSDESRPVAESFSSVLPVRVVTEPRQGLAHARNRALAEATGACVIFTDDDVLLDSDWVASYAAALETYPSAGFFGGRVLPRWGAKSPRWLRDPSMPLLCGAIPCYDLGDGDRPLRAEEPLPFGASFGVRRQTIAAIGEFRTDLGVVGRAPGRGEETEYLARATRQGYHGIYVGSAKLYHDVQWSRLRPSGLFAHGVESGIAAARLRHTSDRGSYLRTALYLIRGGGQLLKGRGDRARQCLINAGIQVGLRRAVREAS